MEDVYQRMGQAKTVRAGPNTPFHGDVASASLALGVHHLTCQRDSASGFEVGSLAGHGGARLSS